MQYNFKKIKFNSKIETYISFLILIFTSSLLVYYILLNANWVFGDDAEFLRTTAIGKMESIFYHASGDGRFFPLGHYDFNVLTFFSAGKSPFAHYLWVAISFIIFIIASKTLFYNIFKNNFDQNKNYSLLITFSILFLMFRFLIVFVNIIFPERIIIVFLTVFMMLYYKFVNTNKSIYFLLTLFVVFYVTYCKEPISGALLVFSMVNLIFNYKKMSFQQKLFHTILVLNAILYFSLYYILVFKNTTVFYTQNFESSSYFELVFSSFLKNKVLVFSFVLLIIRLYFILIKKDRRFLFFDSILFAGISYVFAIILLKLNSSYYFFPSIVLCFPALVFFMFHYMKKYYLVLFIIIFSTLFLVPKSVNAIKANQIKRIYTNSQMSFLADAYLKGKNLLWFQLADEEVNNEFKVQMSWRKEVVECYVNYLLQHNDFCRFKSVSKIDSLSSNDIFLYSRLNNKNNMIESKINALLHDNNFVQVSEIEDIQVFSNQ